MAGPSTLPFASRAQTMAGVRRVSADFINHVMNNRIVRQRHIPDEADAPLFNHHRVPVRQALATECGYSQTSREGRRKGKHE